MVEEASFPRGTPASARPKAKRASPQDIGSSKKHKKKKHKRSEDTSDVFNDATYRTGANISSVSSLRLGDIAPSAKVLACVISTTASRATLALPSGVRGHIEYDAKKETFRVGRCMRCVVTKVDSQKKRVKLTASLESLYAKLTPGSGVLKSGEIVPAFVESEEDHGYTLSFGKSGIKGFLPNQEIDDDQDVPTKSIIDVAVASVDRRGVVKCSLDKTLLSTQIAKTSAGDLTLDDLIPGMLVMATVKTVLSGGVVASFMSYFTATVDAAHLPKLLSEYKPGAKFQARILYIDSENKTISLSALPHLVSPSEDIMADLPKTGALLKNAVVLGVDDKQGLLLKMDHESRQVDGFCHVSNVADKAVDKVSQAFSSGQEVDCRVIGYRPMEKMVNVTLKASVIEQQIISHEDVRPGTTLTGTIVAVRDFGLVMEVAKNVRGVCPLIHMSDVTSVEPNWGKFKEKSKVKCLVVDCDPRVQKITLSLKRSLVKSDLPRITSLNVRLQDTVSHGVITGVADYGVFVVFCGNVRGLAHVSELGLSKEETPQACFDVGQVVKCRVIGVKKQRNQLVLSMQTQKISGNFGSDFEVGSPGSVRVNKGLENDLECTFVTNSGEEHDGLLHMSHLSDSVAATKILKDWLENDYFLDKCAVLNHGNGSKLRLTRKESLVKIGRDFIKTIDQVKRGEVMYGYLHRILPNKCVIKFLGGLMGIVPKSQISERFVVDPANHLCLGQTVCCRVTDVNEEDKTIILTLKHEDDLLTRSVLLASLWEETETAHRTSLELGKGGSDFSELGVGSKVTCTVNSKKDYGVVCDIEGQNDLIGLITHDHATKDLKEGEEFTASVLDYDKIAGYVDLSMKQDLCALKPGDALVKKGKTVDAVVQLVHENCLVASLPDHKNAIAFVSFKSMNQQLIDAHGYFHCGQKIQCEVCESPSESTNSRTILQTRPLKKKASGRKKSEQASGKLVPGTWTTGIVESVQPLQIGLRLKNNIKGRLHITELAEDMSDMSDLAFGKEIRVRVLGWDSADSSHFRHFEVSTRTDTALDGPVLDLEGKELVQGGLALGIIQDIQETYLWVAFSRTVRGRLHILESSSTTDFAELSNFKDRFQIGERIKCRVSKIDEKFKNVDLAMPQGKKKKEKKKDIRAGDLVCGIVTSASALSIQVQISPKRFGRIFVTDAMVAGKVERPLEAISVGQVLKSIVLEIQGNQIELGLPGAIGSTDEKAVARKVADFQVGQEVCGYVKNVTTKGCFVSLSRHLHAHIKLKNLSTRFVVDPTKEFPRGKFVRGKILDINASKNQMEMTLRSDARDKGSVTSVSEGDVVTGRITRLEKYGAFCYIEEKKLTGLIHISELGEDFVKTVASVVSVGDQVQVAVTKVDEQKARIYLSMKGLGKVEEEETSSDESEEGGEEEDVDRDVRMEDRIMADFENEDRDEDGLEESDDDLDEKRALLSEMASGGEPVAMETEEEDTWTDFDAPKQVLDKDTDKGEAAPATKPSRRKEADVRAAELARLNNSAEPTSKADYERLVLVSPNDSYTWIGYMAFLLSLREVEEARKVAERALEVINYREQEEKHNVWVAYLNLEFEHGAPPSEEAAMALFRRGLPYNDSKRFHLALLSILRDKSKDDLAKEVLGTMCKKFRDDPEVWLQAVEYHVTQKREKAASKVMDRSLKSLDPRDHIQVISRCGLVYYRHGYHEQARHMFESIMRTYPKKTELVSTYIDQEIKLGEHDRVRMLFDRLSRMDLGAKKMKKVFKKWMDYMSTHGSDEDVEMVKQKAMDYVQKAM